MTIKPCIYCRHAEVCDIRREFVRNISGNKITTVTFKCRVTDLDYPPGAVVRVSTQLRVDEGGVEDGPTYEPGEVLATVMKRRGFKLLVAVHPGQEPTTDKPMMNVYPKQCVPTEDEIQQVCIHCGKPKGIDLKSPPMENCYPPQEPGPWVCRYSEGRYSIYGTEVEAPKPLPCEYEATA